MTTGRLDGTGCVWDGPGLLVRWIVRGWGRFGVVTEMFVVTITNVGFFSVTMM